MRDGNYIDTSNNEENHKIKNYTLFFSGLGIILGTVFKQVPIGLILGVTIGLILDSTKKK